MALGQNFPVSEYYRDRILDAETIARGGGWWTAALLISDPSTQKFFVGIFRWKLTKAGWKIQKEISFRKKDHVRQVIDVMLRFVDRFET